MQLQLWISRLAVRACHSHAHTHADTHAPARVRAGLHRTHSADPTDAELAAYTAGYDAAEDGDASEWGNPLLVGARVTCGGGGARVMWRGCGSKRPAA